jgi:hypothetical protein
MQLLVIYSDAAVRGGRGERGYNRRGIQDRSTLYFPFYY